MLLGGERNLRTELQVPVKREAPRIQCLEGKCLQGFSSEAARSPAADTAPRLRVGRHVPWWASSLGTAPDPPGVVQLGEPSLPTVLGR